MSKFVFGAIAALGMVAGSIAASTAVYAGDRYGAGSGHNCNYKRTTASVAPEQSSVELASEGNPIILQQLTEVVDETVTEGVESAAMTPDEDPVYLVTPEIN